MTQVSTIFTTDSVENILSNPFYEQNDEHSLFHDH